LENLLLQCVQREIEAFMIEWQSRVTRQIDETFDIGADTGTPIDDRDYQVPSPSPARSAS
jgi:hypothetical protein